MPCTTPALSAFACRCTAAAETQHSPSPPHASPLPRLASHPPVGLEYQDQPAQLNAAAARAEEEAGPPEEWSEAQLPPLADITAEGVRAALLQLQRALHVEGGAAGSAAAVEASPEGLQKAHAMLETCVLPALAELEKQRHPRAGGGAAAQQQQGQQGQQGQQQQGQEGECPFRAQPFLPAH